MRFAPLNLPQKSKTLIFVNLGKREMFLTYIRNFLVAMIKIEIIYAKKVFTKGGNRYVLKLAICNVSELMILFLDVKIIDGENTYVYSLLSLWVQNAIPSSWLVVSKRSLAIPY
jgi:hypothetical protein